MYKTAECVTPKHPDKMCDQISDAILDFCLKQDPNSRVAVETMGGHGSIVIMGEITSNSEILRNDYFDIVKRITGDEQKDISINIVQQSREIAKGVDIGGAGDQGIMVGYACNDNKDMIPQELYFARSLCKFLYEKHPYDGKTQITIDENKEIKTIVASFQNVPKDKLKEEVNIWLSQFIISDRCDIFCNPAGDWSQGGFEADTGLTGRKLMVDNYGPQIPIGGGAFSGKDSTKVDRSAAYIARYMAVNRLNYYKAKEVIVKLAYSIGIKNPVMVSILRDGVEEEITETLIKAEKLTPEGIINCLHLKEPHFEETARWGHFGNGFLWDNY